MVQALYQTVQLRVRILLIQYIVKGRVKTAFRNFGHWRTQKPQRLCWKGCASWTCSVDGGSPDSGGREHVEKISHGTLYSLSRRELPSSGNGRQEQRSWCLTKQTTILDTRRSSPNIFNVYITRKSLFCGLRFFEGRAHQACCIYGFPISGWLPESGVFRKETRRPEYGVAIIKKMAIGLNKAILQQTLNQDRDDAVEATWNSTLEELERGWVFMDDMAH